MSTVERPLRADAERNRRRILDAAAELFTERGLDVTLNDVARHAGVGVGTVYRRFPDKDDLIDALFQERLAAMAAVVEKALEDPDPWHALESAIADMLALQEADRGLKELLLSNARGRATTSSLRDRMGPLVGQLVARAKESGALRPDIEKQDFPLIQVMLGAVIDIARDESPGLWRRYLEILLQGLRADPGPPPPLATPVPPEDRMQCVMQSWRPPRRS